MSPTRRITSRSTATFAAAALSDIENSPRENNWEIFEYLADFGRNLMVEGARFQRLTRKIP